MSPRCRKIVPQCHEMSQMCRQMSPRCHGQVTYLSHAVTSCRNNCHTSHVALLIITYYDSRHLCRSMLDELIRSSPVSRTPLTHSSKSPVQSVIIGTRSTLPPLALTSPGQRRRNCGEECFSGCPPVPFEPCQVTQGRRRGEGLRWKLALPRIDWG